MAGAPAKVQISELLLAFQKQQQATFDAVALDPWSCLGPGMKLCTCHCWFSCLADRNCPSFWEVSMQCEVAETFDVLHGVSIAAN